MTRRDVKVTFNRCLPALVRGGATATTVGHHIRIHERYKAPFKKYREWGISLLRHELGHVVQFERHGFLVFTLLYSIEWVRSRGWQKDGWHRNRYEREAELIANREDIRIQAIRLYDRIMQEYFPGEVSVSYGEEWS